MAAESVRVVLEIQKGQDGHAPGTGEHDQGTE